MFIDDDTLESLGITGNESYDLKNLEGEIDPQMRASLVIHRADGSVKET